jgi:D-amino peptidase
MNWFILTDLEGVAGAERWDQTYEDGSYRPETMVQLGREVNAAVAGIFDADPAAAIDVWDGHGPGGLNAADLDPRARYLREGTPYKEIDGTCAGLLFVGQHAMAGTFHAPLCHTYSSRSIASYRLNGVFIGEFGARALIAGAAGVPTIYLSGDDKAALEACIWVPEIVTAVTKRGQGLQRAIHLPADESCALIRRTAAEACRRAREIPPITMEPPYELEVRYLEPQAWEQRTWRPEVTATVLDSRTVLLRADDLRHLPV